MILADFHLPRLLRPTVAQAARVTCPADVEPHLDTVIDTVENGLRTYPTGLRTGFVAGMAALEAGAVARYGRPFSRLPRAQADAWFAAWWKSGLMPLRQLARGLKMAIVMAYYDLPAIKARLEYHPEAWIAERARQRLASYGVEIDDAEARVRTPDPLIPLSSPRRRRHA
jgi:hypothetical protein